MSGQCTGWVLREGPRPDDVDRTGSKYGQRARGWRAVLVTIADAANRDGEHAYPGHAAMVEGSLYGRSQVGAIVRELIAEGWVTVEAEGGGRGKATVYRVEMTRRQTGRSPAGLVDGNRAVLEDKPRDEEVETARSDSGNRATAPALTRANTRANEVPTRANGKNGVAPLPLRAASPDEDGGEEQPPTRGQRVQKLIKGYLDWCDANGRRRPARVPAAAQALGLMLDAGWTEQQLKPAMIEAPTLSTAALEVALRKRHPSGGRVDEDGQPIVVMV